MEDINNSTGKTEKLILTGKLSIENAKKIHEQVLKSFSSSDNPEVHLSENGKIDLSFLQILYTLLAAARREGKNISLFIDNPEILRDIIEKSGLGSKFNISADREGTDFQIEGVFNE